MKRDLRNIDNVVRELLPSASQEHMETDIEHVFQELHAMPLQRVEDGYPVNSRRLYLLAAAAVFVAVLIPIAMRPVAPASLEITGKKARFGEAVQSGIYGEVVKLEDGSRVEMKAHSELVLERAEDGVRIRLDQGDIIVNAAKQHGHLYVETKDVVVSVVGTVFYVKAAREGSRVAVFEGEVQVKQGQSEKKLGPGDQVASNPKMEQIPVKDDVAWSRAAATRVKPLPQARPREGLAFELARIRPAAPPPAPGPTERGGSSGRYFVCGLEDPPQLDSRRLSMRNQSLFELVAYAYGSCFELIYDMMPFKRISGGPDWVRSDGWDIEALIPEGSVDPLPATPFGGAILELVSNRSPKVQRMLQTLLEERFKVVVRSEKKEMPVYVLSVLPGGPKFQGKEQITGFWLKGMGMTDAPGRGITVAEGAQVSMRNDRGSCLGADGRPGPRGRGGPICTSAIFANQFMDEVATHLSETQFAGRPVINRTDIQERVSFRFDLPEVAFVRGRLPQPFSFKELARGLATVGLDLKEDPKGLVEVLVIERAEKPSEN